MYDSISTWMWILCNIQQHEEKDQRICYILLQDHAQHQATWLCDQQKDLLHDKHPQLLINSVSQ